jgi:hypothetical protein
MAARESIREDVLELLWDHYCATVKYQRGKNGIQVKMTFNEYLSLWSDTRIKSMAVRIDRSEKAIRFYMTNATRPVCSWVSKDAMVRGGVMTVEMAKIRSAEDSKRLFQFQAGDRHSEGSKKRIGDAKRGRPQTPEQVAKRTAARVATMARKRAERELGLRPTIANLQPQFEARPSGRSGAELLDVSLSVVEQAAPRQGLPISPVHRRNSLPDHMPKQQSR